MNENARGVLQGEEPFVLYLRPFTVDGRLKVAAVLPTAAERYLMGPTWEVEFALAYALGGRIPLLAIGRQNRGIGAARIESSNTDWRELFEQLAQRAAAIVVVPAASEGTAWEMMRLRSEPSLGAKTILIMPPWQAPAWWRKLTARWPGSFVERSWRRAQIRLARDGLNLPKYDPRGAFLWLGPDGTIAARAALSGFETSYFRQALSATVVAAPDPELRVRMSAWLNAVLPEPVEPERSRSSYYAILWSALGVLAFRDVLFEPFRQASTSMMPTVLDGDRFFANKFAYGLRLPFSNMKIIEFGEPRRGDVVVFRLPADRATPYVKRLVGLPGDHIRVRDKRVWVNGELQPVSLDGIYEGFGHTGAQIAVEQLGDVAYRVLYIPVRPSLDFDDVVPAGHYFFMGDNRDNSRDSRFPEVGFVPESLIVGKVTRVFFHWEGWGHAPVWSRIGQRLDP